MPKKKKPQPKSAQTNGALAAEAKAILPRLRAGATTVGRERDRLHEKSNARLRRALVALLGGDKKAYLKLEQESRAAFAQKSAEKK